MDRFSKILFILAISSFAFISQAIAQPQIEFQESNHNFGEVVEGDQAVHEFTFTNSGDQPLVISRVSASCGCTTPFWTKEPVMPGKTGVIKASYNSQGRPGNFRKSITIVSNASTPSSVVFIQGNVIKRPPTAEEIAASSKIEAAITTQNIGKVEMAQTVPVSFEITNSGKNVLQLQNIRSNCNCIFFGPEFDRAIGSGESEEMVLYYTPAQTGNWVELVTLYTNDVSNREFKLVINAEVVEKLAEGSTLGARRGF